MHGRRALIPLIKNSTLLRPRLSRLLTTSSSLQIRGSGGRSNSAGNSPGGSDKPDKDDEPIIAEPIEDKEKSEEQSNLAGMIPNGKIQKHIYVFEVFKYFLINFPHTVPSFFCENRLTYKILQV